MTVAPARRLFSVQAFVALLLAIFVVAFGYGFLLPILPSLVRQIAGVGDSAAISRHTGLSNATYALALFLLAPVWGRFADRYGRRRILLLGLGGLTVTLALSAAANSIPAFYIGRFSSGVFAAAIVPATYALVSAVSSSEERRAHRFAFLTVANSLGFLAGPMAGGLLVPAIRTGLPNVPESFALRTPFLASAALAAFTVVLVYLVVRSGDAASAPSIVTRARNGNCQIMVRLLIASFATASVLGALEVGVSLLGTQTMSMSPDRIGLMFADCMIVMLLVQALIFSPLVKIDRTRWLFTPGLALAAVSLALLPFARTDIAMAVAVAAVAASAEVVAPIVTYWISRTAGEQQGAGLGRDTAAQNLGQASGAAAAGLLFGTTFVPNAAFTLTALVVLAGAAATLGLPRLLMGKLR